MSFTNPSFEIAQTDGSIITVQYGGRPSMRMPEDADDAEQAWVAGRPEDTPVHIGEAVPARLPIDFPIGGESTDYALEEPEIIRPTMHSDEVDIARYLRQASEVCVSVRRDLVTEGVFRPGDFVKLTPVDGCFHGHPPKPRVTISEVIAVVIDKAIIAAWHEDASFDRKVSYIAKSIQLKSKSFRQNFRSRVYILFYEANNKRENNEVKYLNNFIAADFDQKTIPGAPFQEYMERRDLLNDLRLHFRRDAINEAARIGGGASAATTPLKNFISDIRRTWSRGAVERTRETNTVLAIAVISIVVLLFAVVLIQVAGTSSRWGTLASILGFLSMLSLGAVGDWANELEMKPEDRGASRF